ncbi:hypothetical protein CTheo_4709 [Ceratobasidium theobromae]|uniref:Uncharacterized protein n=1 Tax=Ceratobasidium theobromae TaxID=1582974 RepID=A0A5N5QJP0_9AGAM|nr:hypothetical protein CTheo_4709 [Ceratobasidium theobromae]
MASSNFSVVDNLARTATFWEVVGVAFYFPQGSAPETWIKESNSILQEYRYIRITPSYDEDHVSGMVLSRVAPQTRPSTVDYGIHPWSFPRTYNPKTETFTEQAVSHTNLAFALEKPANYPTLMDEPIGEHNRNYAQLKLLEILKDGGIFFYPIPDDILVRMEGKVAEEEGASIETHTTHPPVDA